MQIVIALFVILCASAIGSFLNVCIYRLPRGQTVVFGASKCPGCGAALKKYDMVPVVSYFLLKGRCRLCGRAISPRYPFVEALNIVLYLLLFYFYGISAEFVLYAALSSALIVIAFIDYDFKIIPDSLVAFVFLSGAAYHAFGLLTRKAGYPAAVLGAAAGIFSAAGVLYLMAIIFKGGMGGGDIKLMAALGFCLGWDRALLALFAASLVGAAVSAHLLFTKKGGLKTAIPFGPFLAAGAFIIMCFGDFIIQTYINVFLL